MNTKKENENMFIDALDGVKPIKKSNKVFKKYNLVQKKNIRKKTDKSQKEKKLLQHKFQITEKTKNDFVVAQNPKLRRKIQIDKKVDFHGLSVVEAKKCFEETIENCFYSNQRYILFVTGKGVNLKIHNEKTPSLYKGKIRKNFLEWVNDKTYSKKILNFSSGGMIHGGDGAFIVCLRKNKN
mgnify:CR=1 FL=1|tara:strand:+ start:466 stop:1011 length:546 start_codon:yes stop_codon:yes gene_type:complete